jgi:zinc D-Ala-D-Ala carboxypeptidase
MRKARRQKRIKLLVLVTIIAGLAAGIAYYLLKPDPAIEKIPTIFKNTQQPENGIPQFDKSRHSLSVPASLWVIVNKGRKLPSDYVPSDLVTLEVRSRSADIKLRKDASQALNELFSSAAADNVSLLAVSAYRSYSYQAAIYKNYVASQGQAATDATSARPGHSEHQTGLAIDIGAVNRRCELEECFGQTSEGRWLAANAHNHGFIIRYPQHKRQLTGYSYEPWHLRFVGKDLAAELQKTALVMEQFFGLETFDDYPAEITQLR